MKISKNIPLEKAIKFCYEHKPMIIGTALGMITGGLILLFNTEELAEIIDSLEEVAKDTCNTNGPINAIIEWMPD